MYHFFVETEAITKTEIHISGKDVNHIKNVLRLQPGEEISVSCNGSEMEYRCSIDCYTEDTVCCKILFCKESGVELPSKVYLFQGLPKADKMEWIVQKAVELGVYEIIPVSCKRSIVKFDAKKATAKRTRWQGISEAAAKQSQRAVIPKVCDCMTMKEAIAYAKSQTAVGIIPYELAEGMEATHTFFDALEKDRSIAVFIGPEGGFETSEITAASEAGILPISLGKRILRTETAGLVVLSWIAYRLESDF